MSTTTTTTVVDYSAAAAADRAATRWAIPHTAEAADLARVAPRVTVGQLATLYHQAAIKATDLAAEWCPLAEVGGAHAMTPAARAELAENRAAWVAATAAMLAAWAEHLAAPGVVRSATDQTKHRVAMVAEHAAKAAAILAEAEAEAAR